LFEKYFGVTLDTFRSPLTPLKKGGTGVKVPLFKGDLGGSRMFCYQEEDFSNILLGWAFCPPYFYKKAGGKKDQQKL
jgi:hypothetical protein